MGRMQCWRQIFVWTVGVVVGPALAMLTAAPASASCVAPSLAVSQTVVVRGEPFELSGAAFGTDCNDKGQPAPPLGAPQTGVAIAFVQAGHVSPMFKVDAAADYTFRVRALLPASAQPGAAALRIVDSGVPGAARSVPQVHLWVRGNTAVVSSSLPAPTFLSGTRSPPPLVVHGPKSTTWAWVVGAGACVAAVVALVVSRGPRHISTQ